MAYVLLSTWYRVWFCCNDRRWSASLNCSNSEIQEYTNEGAWGPELNISMNTPHRDSKPQLLWQHRLANNSWSAYRYTTSIFLTKHASVTCWISFHYLNNHTKMHIPDIFTDEVQFLPFRLKTSYLYTPTGRLSLCLIDPHISAIVPNPVVTEVKPPIVSLGQSAFTVSTADMGI